MSRGSGYHSSARPPRSPRPPRHPQSTRTPFSSAPPLSPPAESQAHSVLLGLSRIAINPAECCGGLQDAPRRHVPLPAPLQPVLAPPAVVSASELQALAGAGGRHGPSCPFPRSVVDVLLYGRTAWSGQFRYTLQPSRQQPGAAGATAPRRGRRGRHGRRGRRGRQGVLPWCTRRDATAATSGRPKAGRPEAGTGCFDS
jgi:hypothetical protein